MHSRAMMIALLGALLGHAGDLIAYSPQATPADKAAESVSFPLPPEYTIAANKKVTLRICYNWSCRSRETLSFPAEELSAITRLMATCSGKSIEERLQNVRIGIWQMERLAEKYQPLLANDRAINDFEVGVNGRTDCVDNATNTTTYLHILKAMGELQGWTLSSPRVRNRFDLNGVHWTAVIIDSETGSPWSIDSWYRPNGHLPMVMPLDSWMNGEKAWEPPFAKLNKTPRSIADLCPQPDIGSP